MLWASALAAKAPWPFRLWAATWFLPRVPRTLPLPARFRLLPVAEFFDDKAGLLEERWPGTECPLVKDDALSPSDPASALLKELAEL